MYLEFEYFDFIPRKEFKEGANRVLNEICKDIPFDYKCEARCTFFANKFFFQIIFRNQDDVALASQTILDPKKEKTECRDWQLRAIEHMSGHIKRQLEQIKNLSSNAYFQASG